MNGNRVLAGVMIAVAAFAVAAVAAGPAPGGAPVTTRAARAANAGPPGPWAPEVLPGKGLAEHDFMYAGESAPLTITIVRGGKVDWTYTHPGKGEISDATRLSNGNIVFAYQFGAAEVTPEKKVIWEYPAPAGREIHTVTPMGKEKVMLIENGDPAKLKVINITTGAVEKEFELAVGNPKQVHPQFRRARVTAAGTFLVSHMDMGKVSEYDGDGKELWTVAVRSPWSAERLKNGNTLIASNSNFVREVNPKGETVWEFRQADTPEIRLFNTQTAYRLANGNTIINNWRGKSGQNVPVQAIEVTPEKKVVWALRSWEEPANLGPSTNIQLLDEPGVPEDGEMQR
jgi:hypothetical protein